MFSTEKNKINSKIYLSCIKFTDNSIQSAVTVDVAAIENE